MIAYLIARERLKVGKVEEAVKEAMKKIKGAYSLVVASPRKPRHRVREITKANKTDAAPGMGAAFCISIDVSRGCCHMFKATPHNSRLAA